MAIKLKVVAERFFNNVGCPFCRQGESFLVRGAVLDGIEYRCVKCSQCFVVRFDLVDFVAKTIPLKKVIKRRVKK